ncbi:MAG TPA: NUDIX domain-containing protein, partial [archaeon]|nr:NUDIX domain-containing protein [archaeon]
MPELLYQVDEQDTVLGPIERKEAHKNLRLHRSGMVFIANSKGQIFIQNRAKTETFPDCYDSSSAFHIKFGESYEEAAHRELFEETAIKTELRLIGKF